MDALVAEGKVRVKGQSAYSADDFERAVPVVKPQVLQSWAHALDDQFIRPGSRVADLMEEHGMTFVAFSPLAQARLLDKYDPAKPPAVRAGRPPARQRRIRRGGDRRPEAQARASSKTRFGDTTEDLAAVALGYILAQPRVACVIPGFRNERQARCNLAGDGRALSRGRLALHPRNAGLIRPAGVGSCRPDPNIFTRLLTNPFGSG